MGSKGASWVFFHMVVAWRARRQTLLPLSAYATYPDSSPRAVVGEHCSVSAGLSQPCWGTGTLGLQNGSLCLVCLVCESQLKYLTKSPGMLLKNAYFWPQFILADGYSTQKSAF